MSDDDWGPEELDMESAMLALHPGEYRELHGVVVACSADGMRACMSLDAWRALRGEKAEE